MMIDEEQDVESMVHIQNKVNFEIVVVVEEEN